jgi:uncharacterized protein (TIGR04552 family)
LYSLGFEPEDNADQAQLNTFRDEAIDYLRRHHDLSIASVFTKTDVVSLIVVASGTGRKQALACAILKVMCVLFHLRATRGTHAVANTHQGSIHYAEEKVYQLVGSMMSEGYPVTEFVGGRKSMDSALTKVLHKQMVFASTINDRLRFRIVTRTRDDLLPILNHLLGKLFPFVYVVPGSSTNTLLDFDEYCKSHVVLRSRYADIRRYGGSSSVEPNVFRVLKFAVDMPVRMPDSWQELHSTDSYFGRIEFFRAEIQVLDAETEALNEISSPHGIYKREQKSSVLKRLLGPSALEDHALVLPPMSEILDAD